MPQGGPLSPLVMNVMLDDLDRELKRRAHTFVRDADDVNVYIRSAKAAQRAFAAIGHFLASKLKPQINPDKSAVARASTREFLGYGLIGADKARLKVAAGSLQRLRQRVKDVQRGSAGQGLQATIGALNSLLHGWVSYFKSAQVKDVCGRNWTGGFGAS